MSLEPLELLAQLIVAIVVFSLCMSIFFKKLLFVLQERELKTIFGAKEADGKIAEARERVGSYRRKIEMAHGEAQRALRAKKEAVVQREEQKYKDQENKIFRQMEQEKKKMLEEAHSQKKAVLEEADELASALNRKFLGERG